MAIDNSPRRRQARQLARREAKREPYDRVLIVSEGKKTEVLYFKEIARHYKLGSAQITVCHSEYGTLPLQVVEYALDLCEETRTWEHVFCVIDRDDHDRYEDALNKARSRDKKIENDLAQPIRVKAIPSNPSFELWLLLHFQRTEGNIHRDDVFRLLRDRFIPGYTKGAKGIFEATRTPPASD